MAGGVQKEQWPAYISEILRVLKPKVGWAQFIELPYPFAFSENDSLSSESPLSKVYIFNPTTCSPIWFNFPCALLVIHMRLNFRFDFCQLNFADVSVLLTKVFCPSTESLQG